jgi:hypothetical protein
MTSMSLGLVTFRSNLHPRSQAPFTFAWSEISDLFQQRPNNYTKTYGANETHDLLLLSKSIDILVLFLLANVHFRPL